MRISLNNGKVLTLLWLLIFFFPTYLFTSSNSIGQIFFFISYLVILTIIFLSYKHNFTFPFPSKAISVIITVYSSILLTFLFKLSDTSFNELINHSRFLFYALVFFMVYNLFLRVKPTILDIEKVLTNTVILLVIFNVIHIIKPELVSFINNRPVWGFRGISLGGPFVWSYIFSFCLIPILFYFIHHLTFNFRFKYLFLVMSIFCLLLLGQSKSCYLALFFCTLNYLMIAFVLKLKNRMSLFMWILFFFLLIGVILIANSSIFDAIINGFKALMSNKHDASTSGRVRQINVVLVSFNSVNLIDMFFGVNQPNDIIENAFFSYLYKYGLVGLVGYIAFYCYMLLISYRYLNKKAVKYQYMSIFIGFNAMMVALFFFSLGSSPIDANKSSYFFFFVWAAISYIRQDNDNLTTK